jgi:hypothetical protein
MLMAAREVGFISSTVGNWLHVDAEYDIRLRWIAIGSRMLCESAQCYLIWNDAALDRSNRHSFRKERAHSFAMRRCFHEVISDGRQRATRV